MKILRFYWSPDRQKMMNDQVLSVVRETKTQLIAIDRRNPRCEYRFRKPANPQTGMHIYQVGKHERFSQYHYEICLE
jgi:hypothetical protein